MLQYILASKPMVPTISRPVSEPTFMKDRFRQRLYCANAWIQSSPLGHAWSWWDLTTAKWPKPVTRLTVHSCAAMNTPQLTHLDNEALHIPSHTICSKTCWTSPVRRILLPCQHQGLRRRQQPRSQAAKHGCPCVAVLWRIWGSGDLLVCSLSGFGMTRKLLLGSRKLLNVLQSLIQTRPCPTDHQQPVRRELGRP
jgi:hypothetical protein